MKTGKARRTTGTSRKKPASPPHPRRVAGKANDGTLFPGIGRKTVQLNARRIGGKGREQDMILLAIEEVDDLAQGQRRS